MGKSSLAKNCGGGDRGRRHLSSLRGVSPSLNRTVTCMVLKANDRRTSCPCHDEFRGPRSDYVRQKDLAGMYQLCIIVGSSDQRIVLPQEDRVSGGHVGLLRGKTAVFGEWLWCIVLNLQKKFEL
ncbi:uncharacterized protein TNCV_1778991 [Trichonephila clavipes]|nr:uncharacterized protein TNCV_1778991 [Trichonephila clavipes]